MSELHHYVLRAASREALLDMLEAAQAGKARPFVVPDESGARHVDPSRIRYPYAEMTAAVFDPAFPGRSRIVPASPVPPGPWSMNAAIG